MGIFQLFSYQKAETHQSTLYGEKYQHYQKKRVLRIFDLIRYQNAEIHGNHPIWGNETTLPDRVI